MKREVKIGLFAIVIICCSWAGIRFLSGIDIFGNTANYYVAYDEITGINSASPILIQGVKVGKVTEIILEPEKSDKVTVKLSIKKRYKIPADSYAKIFSPGLMSSMAIGLELGSSSNHLQNGDTISSKVELGIMDLAADKLVEVTDMVSVLGAELTVAMNSINELISGNKGNIDTTLSSLSKISSDMASLLDSQSSNIEQTVEGFTKLSTSLGENSQDIDDIINNLSALSSELSQADLATSLSTTLEELNSTLSKINSAEGSVGKLINDEELYTNLAAVGGSLNELLIDMQANPKRYVHFSLFGSKEQ